MSHLLDSESVSRAGTITASTRCWLHKLHHLKVKPELTHVAVYWLYFVATGPRRRITTYNIQWLISIVLE